MTTESGLGYTLYPPKSYTSGRKSGQPTVIFIHTTEGSEGPQSAEDGAAYDARRTDGTSTHFFVDSNSVVQCVLTTNEAHAARTHGNDVGIQIEVCGTAGQSAAQWADIASAGTLEQLAHLCVKLRAQRPGRFPLVNLTPAQLAAGQHGFAEHYDATRAWPEDGGTHTDPGPNFPWAKLFARITELEGDDEAMAFIDTQAKFAAALDTYFADKQKDNKNPVGGCVTGHLVGNSASTVGLLLSASASGTAAALPQLAAIAKGVALENDEHEATAEEITAAFMASLGGVGVEDAAAALVAVLGADKARAVADAVARG